MSFCEYYYKFLFFVITEWSTGKTQRAWTGYALWNIHSALGSPADCVSQTLFDLPSAECNQSCVVIVLRLLQFLNARA